MNSNEVDMEGEKVMKKNIEHLGKVEGGRKGSCGRFKNGGMIVNDVPIIWKKQMGNIMKGTFCNLDGEWYWEKVASCGCTTCGGGNNYSMEEDFIIDGGIDDMITDFD